MNEPVVNHRPAWREDVRIPLAAARAAARSLEDDRRAIILMPETEPPRGEPGRCLALAYTRPADVYRFLAALTIELARADYDMWAPPPKDSAEHGESLAAAAALAVEIAGRTQTSQPAPVTSSPASGMAWWPGVRAVPSDDELTRRALDLVHGNGYFTEETLAAQTSRGIVRLLLDSGLIEARGPGLRSGNLDLTGEGRQARAENAAR